MRILLLNPPFMPNYSRQSRSPCVAKSGTIYYAYYLAYAGCALEQAGYEVVHHDAIIEEKTHEQCLDFVKEVAPDFILMDTSTPSIRNDIEFAARIKSVLPGTIIAACGTFPSKNTDEFFKINSSFGGSVELALRGEYEESVVAVVKGIAGLGDWRAVEGVAYKDDDGIQCVGDPQMISEETLENLPFVSEYYLRHFGEVGIRRHFYASINWPYIQILTSRGCPYTCSFCNIPSIGSYRTRSVESVMEEFAFIRDKMGFVKEVFIEDDTFPINKKRTLKICEGLIEINAGVTWSCNARVNTDKEVLAAMNEAGCRLTCVGFESPAKEGLKGVIKRTSLEQQEKYMADANDVGMKVNGCFILGLPGDDEDSIAETVNYSIKLQPNTVQFYPHMLYPGTGSFDWAESEGMVAHKNWDDWVTEEGFHNTPLSLPGISSSRLLELCDDARMKFYTNPRYLLKMLIQSIKSPKELQRMLIAGRSFFPLLMRYIFKKPKDAELNKA